MTPVAGTDCFVVLSCNESGEGCSVDGTTPLVGNRDQYPIQVILDANDYVWVAVIQYALGPAGEHVPYWVQLYKSVEPLDCDAVKAAGNDGYTPVGPGATEWMALKCEGRHAEWTDSDCPSPTTAPLFDAPFVGLTFFHSRYGCCQTLADPCNLPQEGYCPPIEPECCDGPGTTFMAVELFGIDAYEPPFPGGVLGSCDRCPELNGTFILGPMRLSGGLGNEVCSWDYCEQLTGFCPDISSAYRRLLMTLQTDESGWTLTISVDGGTDCDDLESVFPALTVAVYSGPTYSLPDISPCTVEDYELELGSVDNFVCDVASSTCFISNV